MCFPQYCQLLGEYQHLIKYFVRYILLVTNEGNFKNLPIFWASGAAFRSFIGLFCKYPFYLRVDV